MSDAWLVRQAEKQRIKQEKKKAALIRELEKKGSGAALQAALDIIRRQDPELLAESVHTKLNG